MFLENYFDNKRDRDDFLIALVVIFFFIWLLWQIGFSAFDGLRNKVSEATSYVSMSDADGDGILDINDECKDVKGLEIYAGCPNQNAYDRDRDEVPNSKDKCPDVKGEVLNDGCPLDTDGDGFADANDSCPNIAGDFDGCPDSDKDGIADHRDKCPKEVGTKENSGCPQAVNEEIVEEEGETKVAIVDTDGDGVADDKDKCPNVKGDAADGCPKVADADGDGIEDKKDRCPNEKGTASTSGCPDKDNDGVADKLDKCPDVKGLKNLRGCPDADRDGVADKDDKCPNERGVKPDGCPKKDDPNKDSDGDGVIDRLDNCPNKAGSKANKGCPEVKLDESEKKALSDAIKNVQFDNAKATLKSGSISNLMQIANIMKKYPTYKLSIEGHTSADGKPETNDRLSKARAKACYDFLISKGIKANRMQHKGFGETRLKDRANPNSATNRRVEFDLYE